MQIHGFLLCKKELLGFFAPKIALFGLSVGSLSWRQRSKKNKNFCFLLWIKEIKRIFALPNWDLSTSSPSLRVVFE